MGFGNVLLYMIRILGSLVISPVNICSAQHRARSVNVVNNYFRKMQSVVMPTV